jgi:hypothetical protein
MSANERAVDEYVRPVENWPENDEKYGAQLRAMQDAAFCRSTKYTDQQARAKREGAHPDILEFERVFIKRLRKLNLPFYAFCVVRSRDEQRAAYVTGVSRMRGDRAYPHMKWAVDIIHCTKGWELSRKQWEIVGHIGMETAAQLGIKVVWGANFTNLYDPAHWELAEWRALAEAEA